MAHISQNIGSLVLLEIRVKLLRVGKQFYYFWRTKVRLKFACVTDKTEARVSETGKEMTGFCMLHWFKFS